MRRVAAKLVLWGKCECCFSSCHFLSIAFVWDMLRFKKPCYPSNLSASVVIYNPSLSGVVSWDGLGLEIEARIRPKP